MNAARTIQHTTRDCAHSNGKPGVTTSTNNINVWFAPNFTIRFRIEKFMKTSIQNRPVDLAPRSMAAQFAGHNEQAMKNKIRSMTVIGLAAMTLAGCQRPAANPPEDQQTPGATNPPPATAPIAPDTGSHNAPAPVIPGNTNIPPATNP